MAFLFKMKSMKTNLLLILAFFAIKASALNIHAVNVSPVSLSLANISVVTEADELYYFHSAQHLISGNAIEIKLYFVYGFGSTLSYLNNNVEIPLNTAIVANYALSVKVYYLEFPIEHSHLQDEWKTRFKTPLLETVTSAMLGTGGAVNCIMSPNPSSGAIYFPEQFPLISVYNNFGDKVGTFKNVNTIDLSDFSSGFYWVVIENSVCKPSKLMLKK